MKGDSRMGDGGLADACAACVVCTSPAKVACRCATPYCSIKCLWSEGWKYRGHKKDRLQIDVKDGEEDAAPAAATVTTAPSASSAGPARGGDGGTDGGAASSADDAVRCPICLLNFNKDAPPPTLSARLLHKHLARSKTCKMGKKRAEIVPPVVPRCRSNSLGG